jgi:uncharacterized membrane protein
MEDLGMNEKAQITNNSKMHATILGVIGIILVIVGTAIAIIHNPLRSSGLGTISIVTGVVLLIIALIRFTYKRA